MKLIECPRDAMQGLPEFVATADKIRYINAILKVGFDTVDFGSFVSAKAIPQLRDTAEVLEQLQESPSQLLAIVANERGAQTASEFSRIHYLGYPLSVSETFQKLNTSKSITESWQLVEQMQNICIQKDKTLVVYISMGFGNLYGDPFSSSVVVDFVGKLKDLGVKIVALADTVGKADIALIEELFSSLIPNFPDLEIGAHFHSEVQSSWAKLEAAYRAGCRRFDTAIGGMGGCPMAENELVGNIQTEIALNLPGVRLDREAFEEAIRIKKEIFG
jgi:hydroxymethylglutaryl-CoA lyase